MKTTSPCATLASLLFVTTMTMAPPSTSMAATHKEPNCEKAATTQEINTCAQIDADKAEAELNKVYKSLMSKYSVPDEPMLSYSEIKRDMIAAQRAWIVMRTKECGAVYKLAGGGSINTVMEIGCMQQAAKERTTTLRQYLAH